MDKRDYLRKRAQLERSLSAVQVSLKQAVAQLDSAATYSLDSGETIEGLAELTAQIDALGNEAYQLEQSLDALDRAYQTRKWKAVDWAKEITHDSRF